MLKKLFQNKKNIIAYIISALVSGVSLGTGTVPFGIAIFGAIETIKVPLLIPFIIINIVTGIFHGKLALITFLMSSMIYVGLNAFIKMEESKTAKAIKVLVATAISQVIVLIGTETLMYDSLMAIYTTIASAIFYVIFAEGIEILTNTNNNKIISSETLIATSILIMVGISKIGSIGIFGMTLRGIIGTLIVMVMGWKKGACLGATTGIAISTVLVLIGTATPETIAIYGFSGLLSGVFSRFGKIGAIMGFLLGNVALIFYMTRTVDPLMDITENIKEMVIASIVLYCIPKKISTIIENIFNFESFPEKQKIELFGENTIYRLNAVSEVVNEIAGNQVVEQESENQVDEVRTFIKTLCDNTCKKCPNYDNCWNQNYHSMYEMVFNGIERLQEKGELEESDIENDLCENKELLADGMNFSYQIYKVNQNWQERMNEKRKESVKQLKSVSQAIDKLKEDIETGQLELKLDAPRQQYNLQIGTAKIKKNNSIISGDNIISTKLQSNQYIIGISDGMGSGEKANQKSKKIIDTVEKLLKTGFSKDEAVKLANSIIITQNDEEIFATLDLLIVNLENGESEFIKVGSCPTYIKKENDVEIIKTAGLPAGILEEISIDLNEQKIEENDIIVMISDGLIETTQEDDWIADFLQAIKTNNPQRIADMILQEAVDANYGVAQDDMTVIVAKVKRI